MSDHDMGSLVLARLAAAEPRLAIEEALKLLIQHTQATSAGLFLGADRAAEPETRLLWGQAIDQDCLERVREAWSADRERLARRDPVWHAQWCLWPLEGAEGPVLVYLASARSLSVEAVTRSIVGLADVLQTAARAGVTRPAPAASEAPLRDEVEWYLAATPPEHVARRQLELLLHQNQWNLSRVARALGVTRVTVYRKLAKFGIERLRVRRSPLRVRA
jgi:hypothetical protein